MKMDNELTLFSFCAHIDNGMERFTVYGSVFAENKTEAENHIKKRYGTDLCGLDDVYQEDIKSGMFFDWQLIQHLSDGRKSGCIRRFPK